MRPNLGSLSCVARLRIPLTAPVACGAARSYGHAAATRTPFSHYYKGQRPALICRITGTGSEQKRWITQQHIRRMKEAEEQWQQWAKEIKAKKRKSFVELLEERCLLHDVVGERDSLHKIFTEKRVGMYAGIDPTAPSLHVGHMLPFMVLAWGYVSGLPVTFLLGGSTGGIGDPTGRTKGREPIPTAVRRGNIASMHMQLKKLGASIETYGRKYGYKWEWPWRRALVNNNVWWNRTPFLEVMRDLGAYMRLGPMLGRDMVKTRLSGDGMSFSEFSYPLMQAWDWWVLFQKGVQVQVGGSDQFGNILFGMDAVKEISRNTANDQAQNPLKDKIDMPIGLTTPLLTTSSGEKFGKSAGNAIWLDKDLTSTFELYQYFVRTPDDQVERYLKMFTFLPLPKIAEIMEEQNVDPSKRIAQHALAYEFVELIHGKGEADAVSWQHRQLFRSRSSTAEPTPLPSTPKTPGAQAGKGNSPYSKFINPQSGNRFAPATTFSNMPSMRVTLPRSLVYDQPFNKILWSAGLVASKSEGQRVIANNGAYVGSRPGDSGPMSDDLAFTPIRPWFPEKTQEYIIDGKMVVLKLGKWKFKMVEIVSDEEFEEMGGTAPGWEGLKAARETKRKV